jgi:hypothetical protein
MRPNIEATAAAFARPVDSIRTGDEKVPAVIRKLRAMSVRGLARMYSRRDRQFVFRLRRTDTSVVQEGLSPRYTAITLIGMANLPERNIAHVFGTHTPHEVCATIVEEASVTDNLGDAALTLWAAGRQGFEGFGPIAVHLPALKPLDIAHPTVEVAWLLSALSEVPSANRERLRERVADRLMAAWDPTSKLFPHMIDGSGGGRAHVACFADVIYPIQALAKYASVSGSQRALDIASAAGTRLCELQGDAGQWWWHYDYRTSRVIEGYPVYAIHQDAMGPMGLFALRAAGGPDCTAAIMRGMDWLVSAPELNGGSLIDDEVDLIWRKVARREPNKAVRYLQATASRVHPAGRVPAVDLIFPPRAIDFEDRPYHLGWLLYAWGSEHAAAQRMSGAAERRR